MIIVTCVSILVTTFSPLFSVLCVWLQYGELCVRPFALRIGVGRFRILGGQGLEHWGGGGGKGEAKFPAGT